MKPLPQVVRASDSSQGGEDSVVGSAYLAHPDNTEKKHEEEQAREEQGLLGAPCAAKMKDYPVAQHGGSFDSESGVSCDVVMLLHVSVLGRMA